MQNNRGLESWLCQSASRRRMLASMDQPLTAAQVSRRVGLGPDCCSYLLWQLSINGLIQCLNPDARTNRLHWLTPLGQQMQARLRSTQGLPQLECRFPDVDWELYSSTCFSHRSAVLKALTEPLRPPAIRKKALSRDPALRMSVNNVRDVLRLFVEKEIVKPVLPGKSRFPLYEPTEHGSHFRELLLRATTLPDGF